MVLVLSESEKSKFTAAKLAAAYIKSGMKVGLGTGSTAEWLVRHLGTMVVEEGLDIVAVPTSFRTAELAISLGIKTITLEEAIWLDLTIDGTDEFDKNFNLIKGGGGAHTNEKRLAKIADHFICIVDESKIVQTLGNFPLPIEIDLHQSDQALSELRKYSKNISQRESLSDNRNFLYDLHDLKILEPLKIENQILMINGVVDVGIFAIDRPQTVIIGKDSSYKLMES